MGRPMHMQTLTIRPNCMCCGGKCVLVGRPLSLKAIARKQHGPGSCVLCPVSLQEQDPLWTRMLSTIRSHLYPCCLLLPSPCCCHDRRPEFVNRVDEFIVFEPLIRSQIRDIVGLRAAALVARVASQHITLKLGDSALEYLAAKVGGLNCGRACRLWGLWGCCVSLGRPAAGWRLWWGERLLPPVLRMAVASGGVFFGVVV